MDESRKLINMAEERLRQCEEQYMVTCTGFLDPAQQSDLRVHFRFGRGNAKQVGDTMLLLAGGYPDAERAVFFCLPSYVWENALPEEAAGEVLPEEAAELLSVLHVTHSTRAQSGRSGRALRHGDYLGALTGLGLGREVLGDILVREDGADILVLTRIADYLERNFTQAGRASLQCEVRPLGELALPERKVTEIHDSVASLRLDNLVAAAFRLSRGDAQELIAAGQVYVDHRAAQKADQTVEEGALINVRHRGRAELAEAGGETKKGRIRVRILRAE